MISDVEQDFKFDDVKVKNLAQVPLLGVQGLARMITSAVTFDWRLEGSERERDEFVWDNSHPHPSGQDQVRPDRF